MSHSSTVLVRETPFSWVSGLSWPGRGVSGGDCTAAAASGDRPDVVAPARVAESRPICVTLGRRGRARIFSRDGPGFCCQPSTNLKMYFWSSYTGEEPPESESVFTAVVLSVFDRAWSAACGTSGAASASCRRRPCVSLPCTVFGDMSMCEDAAALTDVRERTLPSRDHRLLGSPLLMPPIASKVSGMGVSSLRGGFANVSKPTTKPACNVGSCCRRIINFLAAAGDMGAVEGGVRPSAKADSFRYR